MTDRALRSGTAFGAFDLGTSNMKAALVLPDRSYHVFCARPSNIRVEASGEVTCNATQLFASFRELLAEMGEAAVDGGASELHLGLCAHVSSLILWNVNEGRIEHDDFPIWMDTSSRDSVPALKNFFANGRDRELLSTSMPVVPNWLAVMIYHRVTGRSCSGLKILQIHDYLYHLLSGSFHSHYTGHVSLVDNRAKDYSDELLEFLGITRANLPEIRDAGGSVVEDPYGRLQGVTLPERTVVYPGLADRSAGFLGMDLRDGDGFILASTSENAGVYLDREEPPPERLLRMRHRDGWLYYGSTTAGGSTLNWFFETVVGSTNDEAVAELLERAAAVPPGAEGLIFQPYLAGERAPLWSESVAGSFVGLRTHHRREHLLRAVLEGVAFGKRQLFEELGGRQPQRVKIAGGVARAELLNRIRAAVSNADMIVYDDVEFPVRGLLTVLLKAGGVSNVDAILPPLAPRRVRPDETWRRRYDELYQRFLEVQDRQAPLWDGPTWSKSSGRES
ncbi:MAG: hypothetical protein MK538_13385 [Planctomycetes bacterium]|nr:hypothetical protein [Planctomycetota bacterium]